MTGLSKLFKEYSHAYGFLVFSCFCLVFFRVLLNIVFPGGKFSVSMGSSISRVRLFVLMRVNGENLLNPRTSIISNISSAAR